MPGSKKETGILTHEEAEDLRQQDWHAADLHVHTFFSRDVLPAWPLHPLELYNKSRRMGLEFITFTDHDTMDAYDLIGWNRENLVTGVEIKIKDMAMVGHTIHVNVYDLNKDHFNELEEIARDGDLKAFLAYLKRNELPFVYNHPLWFEPDELPNLAAIPKLAKLFPVLEYNMYRIHRKNELVMNIARKYNRGLVASTDTHSGSIGKVYTLSRGDTFKEYFRNIKKGNSYIVIKDLTKDDLVEEINAWIGMIFRHEMVQEASHISTGVGYVDKIIRILSSNTLMDFPRLQRSAMGMAYKISNSGLPALLYLRSEKLLLPEIEREMAQTFR